MKKKNRIWDLINGEYGMKSFNGWNHDNEMLWHTLTSDEKAIINNIMIAQMEHFLPHERLSFKTIVDIVRPNMGRDIEFLDNLTIIKLIKGLYGDNIN